MFRDGSIVGATLPGRAVSAAIGAWLSLGLGRLVRRVGLAEMLSGDDKLGATDTRGVGGIDG